MTAEDLIQVHMEEFKANRAIRLEYARQKEIALVQFVADMKDTGWKPVLDIYNGIYAWQSQDTGRIVKHSKAYDVWEIMQITPLHRCSYELLER